MIFGGKLVDFRRVRAKILVELDLVAQKDLNLSYVLALTKMVPPLQTQWRTAMLQFVAVIQVYNYQPAEIWSGVTASAMNMQKHWDSKKPRMSVVKELRLTA